MACKRGLAGAAILLVLATLAACGGGGGGGGSGGGGTIAPPKSASTPPSDPGAGGSGGEPTTPDPPPPVDPGGSGDPTPPPDPTPSSPTSPGAGGGADGISHGPAPLDLQAAANFAVIAETAITASAPSVINGNAGLSPASAANMGLTCPQLMGALYTVDGDDSQPCHIVDPVLLGEAVSAGHTAWHVARDQRPADYTDLGGGNIGGMTLPPATYRWSGGVQIPADLMLKGGRNDVWIFIIETNLVVAPGVSVLLSGGARPQNVFWVTLVNEVELGVNAYMSGVILAETFIDMKTGASITGRLMAAQGINLDGNTIIQP